VEWEGKLTAQHLSGFAFLATKVMKFHNFYKAMIFDSDYERQNPLEMLVIFPITSDKSIKF